MENQVLRIAHFRVITTNENVASSVHYTMHSRQFPMIKITLCCKSVWLSGTKCCKLLPYIMSLYMVLYLITLFVINNVGNRDKHQRGFGIVVLFSHSVIIVSGLKTLFTLSCIPECSIQTIIALEVIRLQRRDCLTCHVSHTAPCEITLMRKERNR